MDEDPRRDALEKAIVNYGELFGNRPNGKLFEELTLHRRLDMRRWTLRQLYQDHHYSIERYIRMFQIMMGNR